MAKGKQNAISYRNHEIKEDHSFAQATGGRPGIHKNYSCKVNGRTIKGTLEEVKANIDYRLDAKSPDVKD